jgi:hypothetical protein
MSPVACCYNTKETKETLTYPCKLAQVAHNEQPTVVPWRRRSSAGTWHHRVEDGARLPDRWRQSKLKHHDLPPHRSCDQWPRGLHVRSGERPASPTSLNPNPFRRSHNFAGRDHPHTWQRLPYRPHVLAVNDSKRLCSALWRFDSEEYRRGVRCNVCGGLGHPKSACPGITCCATCGDALQQLDRETVVPHSGTPFFRHAQCDVHLDPTTQTPA